MHTKLERLLWKSLTTLEVMTYYLVVHTGPVLRIIWHRRAFTIHPTLSSLPKIVFKVVPVLVCLKIRSFPTSVKKGGVGERGREGAGGGGGGELEGGSATSYSHPSTLNAINAVMLSSNLVCLEMFVGWLLACLTSQQQASVSQGRICSDNFTCCHT